MSSSRDSGPSAFRFSQVLRGLADSGDSCGVIRLVERWFEHGMVSQTARVCQARAFIDLRLMDRAWVRLREAIAADPADLKVHFLTAEMFILRGWPAKAEAHLDKLNLIDGNPSDMHRYNALKKASVRPPNGPPANAREIERSGTAEQVLALADQYLSVGMHVRAESLLERLVRDGFSEPRVSKLLWGIRADFLSPGMDTVALLQELEESLRNAEWSAIELTDGIGQVEVTAHVEQTDILGTTEMDPSKRGFPSLFRRDDPSGEPTSPDDEEVTMSSLVADEAGHLLSFDITDSDGTPTPGDGDTRIMEVIQRGDGMGFADAQGAIHRTIDPAGAMPVDLQSHRARFLPPDDETFLEDEDKDLIVMTRRESAPVSVTERKKASSK